jgi:uncharacterized protein
MVTKYTILEECTGFDWDKYNVLKNECEEIFFNQPLVISDDIMHSTLERRFYSLGLTDRKRKLFIAFTVRENLIRVVAARDMTNIERRKYKRYEK